jgi:cobaltochelatase CobN
MTDVAPVAALLFHPAPAAEMAGIDALVAALAARGLTVRPLVLAQSDSAASVAAMLDATPPDIVLNTTALAVAADAPVLSVALASDAERIAFIADLARGWVRLWRAAPAERRIVLVLEPALDAAEATVAALHALAASGYRVAGIPAGGAALRARLGAGPSAAQPRRFTDESFPRSDYGAWFASLPRALQDQVHARWGAPERDPFFRAGELDCGSFAIAAVRCGGVIVALEPARGGIDPRHGYLAFRAWIADGVRAHAAVTMGGDGDYRWRPGQALTLPDAAQGPLPHLIPD